MGYTYEVPIRFFYPNGKEMAFFILYSTDKDLKEGVYKYNDVFVPNTSWDFDIVYSNFTFFKGKCRWEGLNIIDGDVTVKKNNDEYEFILYVKDVTGEYHAAIFNGKVKKEKYETQSKIGGVFADASLDNRVGDPWAGPVGLPSNYNGGNTSLTLQAGEMNDGYIVSMHYLHPNKNDPTGTYYMNPNANGYYKPGEIIYQNDCSYNITYANSRQLVSGSITITRVNKPHKFRIDVDVTDEKGGHIQGCFDGGAMFTKYQ